MTYTFQGRQVTKEVIEVAINMINEYKYQIESGLEIPTHIIDLKNDLSMALN